ncbi:hypothetical protein F442_10632 [Phytophthora nicotianae P10297]|uniref:Uncharacterized protein n=2 Tax=Phytophthora nicotianae TaxID=4792 RepID=V9F2M1_PHYNI|nr:hypothetical protein F443_10733 [Phytophthora nicotianae P1569]ETP42462.1 hypothetical protein F442_10632 [Phytophthora nicotianae P10297]
MLWGLYQTTKTNAAATVDGDDVQTTPTYIYSWMLEDRINIGLVYNYVCAASSAAFVNKHQWLVLRNWSVLHAPCGAIRSR